MFVFFALQWMCLALVLMGQPFLFQNPSFLCKAKESSDPPLPCEDKSPDFEIYDVEPTKDSPNNLTKHFRLYGDRAYLITLVQALFFVFGAFAIVIFSYVSDKIGRFPVIAGSFILGAVTLFLARFAPNYLLFASLLIACGIGMNVYTTLSFVIIAESASKLCFVLII